MERGFTITQLSRGHSAAIAAPIWHPAAAAPQPVGSSPLRTPPLLRVRAVRCRRAAEEISRLVGHSGTTVTELVYRYQLKPVIQTGATLMDRLREPKDE